MVDGERDTADDQPQEDPQQKVEDRESGAKKATVENQLVEDDRHIKANEGRYEFGFEIFVHANTTLQRLL